MKLSRRLRWQSPRTDTWQTQRTVKWHCHMTVSENWQLYGDLVSLFNVPVIFTHLFWKSRPSTNCHNKILRSQCSLHEKKRKCMSLLSAKLADDWYSSFSRVLSMDNQSKLYAWLTTGWKLTATAWMQILFKPGSFQASFSNIIILKLDLCQLKSVQLMRYQTSGLFCYPQDIIRGC